MKQLCKWAALIWDCVAHTVQALAHDGRLMLVVMLRSGLSEQYKADKSNEDESGDIAGHTKMLS